MRRPRLEPAPRLPSVPGWAAAITLVWLVAVAAASMLGATARDAPALCLFRRATRVPCPTCGTTRAGLALLDGRPVDALLMNPLVTVTALVLVLGLTLRVVSGRRLTVHATPPWRRVAWYAALTLLAANWGYVVLRRAGT